MFENLDSSGQSLTNLLCALASRMPMHAQVHPAAWLRVVTPSSLSYSTSLYNSAVVSTPNWQLTEIVVR